VGVASDDQRVREHTTRAQQRLGFQQPVLALPRLQSPDDADHRHSRGDLERSLILIGRRRVRSGRHDEGGARREHPFLGQRGDVRGGSDRNRRQQRGATIEPMALGNPVLPPKHPIAHTGQERRRRSVQVRLAHPVQDQVGAARAHDPRQARDRRHAAGDLAQLPGREGVDAKSRRSQLRRPRAGLQKHQLKLMSGLLRPFEHHLQHRLRAAEALSPRYCYQHAHRQSLAIPGV